MPIEYQSKINGDYLRIEAEGSSRSTAETLDYIGRVHDELARTGLAKLLVDERVCHTHINLDGLKSLAADLHGEERFAGKPKVAVVTSVRDHSLLEHVFASADKIRFFTDEPHAREWLDAE